MSAHLCKSCLLKHFEEVNNNCPQCGELIHQSHPSHYVAFDRTLQDIVYRLVPGMFAEEKKRRFDFIRRKNKKEGIVEEPESGKKKDEPTVGAYNKCFEGKAILSHHRDGNQTVVELSPGEGLAKAARNIIRLSSLATINTLKRYLAMCLWKDVSRYQELDIFCNNELMGKDFSMQFIRMTRWRQRASDSFVKAKIIRVYACDGFCGDGQFWPLTRCCEKNDFFGQAGGECQGSRAFCDIGF
ncbi:unnamed protein product, partial [Mesorhabditis belari]|uniref:Uncharacterized protein n=1 Tax=Mesorhabditis belari TaxID=2138241 RepID=A0AAF3F7V0_9BILA